MTMFANMPKGGRFNWHANLVSGNYSRLKLYIQFERSMGYYLIQMYVPSGLIVVISWVSRET